MSKREILNLFLDLLKAPNGNFSSTRFIFMAITLTICVFVWVLILLTLVKGFVPDIPPQTGMFLGGLLGLIAALKGVQAREELKEEKHPKEEP